MIALVLRDHKTFHNGGEYQYRYTNVIHHYLDITTNMWVVIYANDFSNDPDPSFQLSDIRIEHIPSSEIHSIVVMSD